MHYDTSRQRSALRHIAMKFDLAGKFAAIWRFELQPVLCR